MFLSFISLLFWESFNHALYEIELVVELVVIYSSRVRMKNRVRGSLRIVQIRELCSEGSEPRKMAQMGRTMGNMTVVMAGT